LDIKHYISSKRCSHKSLFLERNRSKRLNNKTGYTDG
jgi:hypothetical protein